MHILSTGYSHSHGYSSPDEWLERIGFYTGILEELARTHRVSSIEQIDYEGILKRGGVDYHFIDTRRGETRGATRLNKYIRSLKPDVVLVNGLIFPLQVIHLRSMVPARTKIILLHRAEIPAKGIKRGLQVFADRCVDHYLFVSGESGASWVKKGIISSGKKVVEVLDASSIFKPADRAQARRSTGVEGSPVFLWVGRLDTNKDPMTVVRAFLEFCSAEPGARLYMIYQDDVLLDRLRALISAHPSGNAVKLVGRAGRNELQSWYNSADYFISGSHYEGSGIAAVEAMSCGCIPILTNIVSFRKFTRNGECGLLYTAGQVGELLQRLLQARALNQEEMRAKVLAQFQSEFSFSAIASRINRLIGENISMPQPAEL
jgi:glycosyltransferase involved in cell wall biosynthesis